MFDLMQFGSRIAMIDDEGNEVTYEELDMVQKSIAAAAMAYGSMKSLMFVVCSNTVECIEGYVACLNNNIAAFMVSKDMPENSFESLRKSYMPEYVWLPDESNIGGKEVYNHKGYKLIKMYDSHFPINENLALLLSTSGTTGSRKAVRISYRNIRQNTKSIITALDISKNDRAVTMLPMHYTYGLSVINTHLYAGAALLVTERKVFSSSFWEFFNKNKGTSLSGVAYTYKMLMKMGFSGWELPYLKKITQAGEKLPSEIYSYLTDMEKNKNIIFQPMYGQTEATARISVMPEGMARHKPGSVGIPIDGGRVELLDENGQSIHKSNTKGRLIYKGPNVAMGYASGRDGLSEDDTWNGRLDTGDYAYIDDEGYIFIVGRNDEYVKIGGRRVSLYEIENMLEKQFPSGEFCAAYSNEKLRLACTVEDTDMVKRWICNNVSLNRNMAEVIYFKELPLSDTGKSSLEF